MNVCIKFKTLELVNFRGTKKCIGRLLVCSEFDSMEKDYKDNKLIIRTKTDKYIYERVILKSIEITNENGVKL